jgi:hypothetical protein
MRPIFPTALLAAFLAPAVPARAQAPERVGDAFEIILTRESADEGSDGATGSSFDRDALVERVAGVRADGIVLDYDLPKGKPGDEGPKDWKFPVRVFHPAAGPIRILNRSELESRVDPWLKAAKWTRAQCGRWYFTWNAFHVDCDPDSVVAIVEAFDLRFLDPAEGALYRDAEALAPAPLARKRAGPDGSTWAAELQVDPDKVRRARAESDVASGEIVGKPVTLEAALGERAKEEVSGTVSVTLDAGADGRVWRRTRLIRIRTAAPDGRTETRTVTETLERRRLP